MTKRMPSSRPVPRDSLEVEKIAKSVANKAKRGDFVIIYTDHARDQMDARLIDEKHILKVLEFGRVVEGQERWSEQDKDYSYLIRDTDVDDRDMAVSVAIDNSTDEKLILVTAMLIDPFTGKFI